MSSINKYIALYRAASGFVQRFGSGKHAPQYEALVAATLACDGEAPPECLSVFRLGPEAVIAVDEQDAWDVLQQTNGCKQTDYPCCDEWEKLSPGKMLTVWNEDTDSRTCHCQGWRIDSLKGKDTNPNGHHKKCPIGTKSMTCAQWVEQNGRGFLCSEEY